jgi:uncharacterized protein YecA (UPF0149 family)
MYDFPKRKAMSDVLLKKLNEYKNIYWLEGFVCAVHSAPICIAQKKWMPYITLKLQGDKKEEVKKLIVLLIDHILLQFEGDMDDEFAFEEEVYEPLYERIEGDEKRKKAMFLDWAAGYNKAFDLFLDYALKDSLVFENLIFLLSSNIGKKDKVFSNSDYESVVENVTWFYQYCREEFFDYNIVK